MCNIIIKLKNLTLRSISRPKRWWRPRANLKLDEIIKSPGAFVKEGNRIGGFDVISVDGRGARFDPQGNFRGFLEP